MKGNLLKPLVIIIFVMIVIKNYYKESKIDIVQYAEERIGYYQQTKKYMKNICNYKTIINDIL